MIRVEMLSENHHICVMTKYVLFLSSERSYRVFRANPLYRQNLRIAISEETHFRIQIQKALSWLYHFLKQYPPKDNKGEITTTGKESELLFFEVIRLANPTCIRTKYHRKS